MTDFGVLGVSNKSIFAPDKYNNEHIAEALLDAADQSPRAVAEKQRAIAINWFNYAAKAVIAPPVAYFSIDTNLFTADSVTLTADKYTI